MFKYFLILLLFSTSIFADNKKMESKEELFLHLKNAFKNPTDNPKLPRVLLIGDSISIGYTIPVRKLLDGKVNVHRIPTNGRYASYGVENLKKWLGDKKWDVIHFNWGLWDLCYRHPESKNQGKRDKVKGKITASPDEYQKHMEALVAELKKTGAKLIWCETTPVPENEAGRKVGDSLKYNAIANEIMKKNGIQINHLHAHALKKLPGIASAPGNVHYTGAGSAYLAEKVAEEIQAALKK
ncbi:MAG: SGNH/GDSL hydrolase family protein [Lentisphaeraceae bacterium]|nr:SGNH/GDSL hydrolase family protein [Lentisphaeraceae bacterium]